MSDNRFDVQIAYSAAAGKLVLLDEQVSPGTTVARLLEQCSWYERYPDTLNLKVGIYGRLVTPDTLLVPFDRVELYRPLSLDPMNQRKARAMRLKQTK